LNTVEHQVLNLIQAMVQESLFAFPMLFIRLKLGLNYLQKAPMQPVLYLLHKV